MRDRKGRFVNRRAHEYELAYDYAPRERVHALSASEAVARREQRMLPRTITDLTVMREFRGHFGYARLMRTPVQESAPLTWRERMVRR